MLLSVSRLPFELTFALTIGKSGPWAHREAKYLDAGFCRKLQKGGKTGHQTWLEKLDVATDRSKEEFVKHFRRRYNETEHLPIWIAVELWDFGLLSFFVSGMKYGDRQALALRYGIPGESHLRNWLRSLNLVRNICAHHTRLWNKDLADQLRLLSPGTIPCLDHLSTSGFSARRVYGVAAISRFMLRTISPQSTWPAKFKELAREFPVGKGVGLEQAGFISGWEELDLWK